MNYLPPNRPESPPYGPLQRRLLGLAGLLAALMIALIVFHFLHSGSGGLNAMAEAAERTARQPGAKLALRVTYTVEGASGSKTFVGDGSGAFDARSGRARSTVAVPVPKRGLVSIETIADPRRTFLRSAVFDEELPPGKEWLGMEPFLGRSTETAFGSDGSAKSQLELLGAIGGGVEEVGEENVRGHETTRYKATVELAAAAELLSERGEKELAREVEKSAEEIPRPIPVEAWVDDKGLVREIRLVEPLPSSSGGPSVTMDFRMQLFAFGARPQVELPRARKVLDYTPVLRAELGLEDGSTLGSLAPPATARTLSLSAFRGRVQRLCKVGETKVKSLVHEHQGVYDRLKALGADAARSDEGHALMTAYAVGVVEPGYGALRRFTHRMAAIVPPPRLASAFARYVTLYAKRTEWTLTMARLYELGEVKPPALADRRDENAAEEKEAKPLAKKLGIAAACESDDDEAGARQ